MFPPTKAFVKKQDDDTYVFILIQASNVNFSNVPKSLPVA